MRIQPQPVPQDLVMVMVATTVAAVEEQEVVVAMIVVLMARMIETKMEVTIAEEVVTHEVVEEVVMVKQTEEDIRAREENPARSVSFVMETTPHLNVAI